MLLMKMITQVAHIAGYDDEHHLEKAPILEIDPIPNERYKSQGIQKYQVMIGDLGHLLFKDLQLRVAEFAIVASQSYV